MPKVQLKRAARIRHEVGEIVMVSPSEAQFLIGIGSAQIVNDIETPEMPKRETRKKTVKK